MEVSIFLANIVIPFNFVYINALKNSITAILSLFIMMLQIIFLKLINWMNLGKKGVSKEHRPDTIVKMGLFMDTNGIPIAYKLFPGNALDKTTLIPSLSKIQHDYSLGRIIIVADNELTTGDNI